uniref:Large ribosomal subunit protein uL22c n=1 Tax=Tribulus terrestris TaxID=210369 RepID=A0A8A2Z0B3_TRITE|nr:ribosomal protein L22 [Tribulus terrestris]QIH29965.1 ribosomal protein L22 [Tribulus terrestris]QSX43064.1 ribosomal protein L22 [Tribulus terrestris]
MMRKDLTPYVQAAAVGQNIRMSPDKARIIIDQIRYRPYEEALMILELMPYRAAYPIYKLVYSAAANASHNKGLNKAKLFVCTAVVNESTTVKKFKPRARGRSYQIKRRTCNITIVLRDIFLYRDYLIKYHPSSYPPLPEKYIPNNNKDTKKSKWEKWTQWLKWGKWNKS